MRILICASLAEDLGMTGLTNRKMRKKVTGMPDREKVIDIFAELLTGRKIEDEYVLVPLAVIRDALTLLKEQEPITGDTSDGYHTFNELYHHRAVLFSVIVHDHKNHAWKSTKHSDGTMYDGMFIVGVETPSGQATYHYDMAYWDMFDCKELETAPEWDGHTPAQAIARIGKLKEQEARWIPVTERLPDIHQHVLVYSKFKGVQADFRSKDGHWYTTPAVTHWCELPEPPKEVDDGEQQ